METGLNSLCFENIKKSFGENNVLHGITLEIEKGEIVAFLGENGAGKSTLIKILGGIHSMDSGQITICGKKYQHKIGGFATKQEVAFIHQDLGLIEWMSVSENIALAVGYPKRRGLIDWAQVNDLAKEALKKVNCDIDPSTRIHSLSSTEKALVAIARALIIECDFLVLDEPTASLPADEVETLFTALRDLKSHGVGMIYVSHRLDEVFRIADKVAVLKDGFLVNVCEVGTTNPRELVNMIIGKETAAAEKPLNEREEEILSLRKFCSGVAKNIDLDLHKNEVLGLVGLRGAGHEDIARAMFGLNEYSGSLVLNGVMQSIKSPVEALANGFGLIARDRLTESAAFGLSVKENIFINPQAVGRKLLALISKNYESQSARRIGEKINLKPNEPELAMENLSGGNQQKVIIGRWLETQRKVLICEDPTAGVDVGSKAEIYNLLFNALKQGVGIIVISTDFEEIVNICNRALIFSNGKIVSELSGESLNVKNVIHDASVSR